MLAEARVAEDYIAGETGPSVDGRSANPSGCAGPMWTPR
jgi:hypothetical protein